MDTPEWPGKDLIPANRGIKIPQVWFLRSRPHSQSPGQTGFHPSIHCASAVPVPALGYLLFLRVELLFQLYSCLHFLMLTIYLQSVNEVPKVTSCTWAHFHSSLRWSRRLESLPGTEGEFLMWHMEDREVLAASFSGEQSSKTECKTILTQGSALSQETDLPPLLFCLLFFW